MTKKTRLFVFIAGGVLVAGLGTGLVASYVGIQNLTLIGGNGPAEFAYVPSDARALGYAPLLQRAVTVASRAVMSDNRAVGIEGNDHDQGRRA